VIAAADLSYESLPLADLPAGFFDPQALQTAFLAERLERVRQRPMAAYWLGTERLTDIWPQIDPSPRSGVRFWYGPDGTDLMIESWPSGTNFAERCPLRENGIVVGRIETEAAQTALGTAEYCPSDGWLRVAANGSLVYLWPGPEHETKDELVAITARLRPVE